MSRLKQLAVLPLAPCSPLVLYGRHELSGGRGAGRGKEEERGGLEFCCV